MKYSQNTDTGMSLIHITDKNFVGSYGSHPDNYSIKLIVCADNYSSYFFRRHIIDNVGNVIKPIDFNTFCAPSFKFIFKPKSNIINEYMCEDGNVYVHSYKHSPLVINLVENRQYEFFTMAKTIKQIPKLHSLIISGTLNTLYMQEETIKFDFTKFETLLRNKNIGMSAINVIIKAIKGVQKRYGSFYKIDVQDMYWFYRQNKKILEINVQ